MATIGKIIKEIIKVVLFLIMSCAALYCIYLLIKRSRLMATVEKIMKEIIKVGLVVVFSLRMICGIIHSYLQY
jgi:hypothetical protein